MLISLVVPCFNEEEILERFHERVTDEMSRLGHAFEVVYIDDGSADRTLPLIQELPPPTPRVRYVSFSRNFGKEAAMLAGLQHAEGDAVVLMDADLQHPPELVGRMLQEHARGHDQVIARRTRAATASPAPSPHAPTTGSSTASSTSNSSTGSRLPAPVAPRRRRRTRPHRVQPLLQGPLRLGRLPPHHDLQLRERRTGTGPLRLDLRQAPQLRPGRAPLLQQQAPCAPPSTSACSSPPSPSPTPPGSSASPSYAASTPPGYVTLLVVVTALAGVQMVLAGVVGEYVGRIYYEVKRRPHFLVKDTNTRARTPPAPEEPPREFVRR